MMILQQSRFIYCSKQSGLETPSNVNIEEGESKKQLLQIGELSFGQSEVFAYFGKEDSEWFDGRGTKCLMTDWLIKEQVFGTHPHAGMKRSAGSYEEYHWHTFEAEIHDCIEDSKHVFKQGYIHYRFENVYLLQTCRV
jgi:hypothetical protein